MSQVAADTVQLSGGGHVSGDVRAIGEGNDRYVIVQMDPDLVVAIAGTHVTRIVTNDQLARYKDLFHRAGNDAERNYQLSLWCKENNLDRQAHFHLAKTVRLEPNHKLARAALGYVKEQNEWVSYETSQRRQGMVKVQTRWVLPEALADLTAREESNLQSKLWIKKLDRLVSKALRGDREALAAINAIADPMAATAIAAQLEPSAKRNQPRSLRLTWVRLLAKLQAGPAVATLAKTGLLDQDDVVREEARRLAMEINPVSTAASYRNWLRSPSVKQVRAAASALQDYADPADAMEYVDALVTVVKKKIQQGPGQGRTQAGFGSGGGLGGFAAGGTVIEKDQRYTNPEVLSLVKSVAPGIDYGYDQQKWRRYFASLMNPPVSDLRRDP
ncbi:MAG: HEAT repeat domain-containing protein [Planctomycetota bacterium]